MKQCKLCGDYTNNKEGVCTDCTEGADMFSIDLEKTIEDMEDDVPETGKQSEESEKED